MLRYLGRIGVTLALLLAPIQAFSASAVYPLWKENVIQATANTSLGGTVKCDLIDKTLYTYAATDRFHNIIAAGARIGTAQTLTGKTFTNGRFLASSITFTAVTGNPVGAMDCWIDTGTDSTSVLNVYIDGVIVTPNGGDITINWDATNGIWKL